MAERSFSAPDGTVWHAWNVDPRAHTDWPSRALRHLPESMATGWLCFEAEDEKRRLQPVPEEWERGSDGELWSLCTLAERVRKKAAV